MAKVLFFWCSFGETLWPFAFFCVCILNASSIGTTIVDDGDAGPNAIWNAAANIASRCLQSHNSKKLLVFVLSIQWIVILKTATIEVNAESVVPMTTAIHIQNEFEGKKFKLNKHSNQKAAFAWQRLLCWNRLQWKCFSSSRRFLMKTHCQSKQLEVFWLHLF